MEFKKKLRRKMWMIPFVMIGIGAIVGFVIMGLWNWMMPAIFGLGMITFWQALGLLILGRLIFGGFRKHKPWGWGMRHRHAYAYCQHNSHKMAKETPADHVQ